MFEFGRSVKWRKTVKLKRKVVYKETKRGVTVMHPEEPNVHLPYHHENHIPKNHV